MSEQRSATLTPFGKSDKKNIKSPRKTFRFSYTLSDPSEDSCSVFDYASAVKLEERKIIKKYNKEGKEKSNGVLDPFNDEDDEEAKKLARKFEEKYGDKKIKSKSYRELGAGYDETDPFIDNTEAYDETLEEDQETACGGYYINSGPLELKRVEISDQSDMDEVAKHRHKRNLPVIKEDEDEEEEEVRDEEETEDREEENVLKTEKLAEERSPEAKRSKISTEREDMDNNYLVKNEERDELIKKRKKRLSEDMPPVKPKKIKTVKALLEEKRVHEASPAEPKRNMASEISISEAIESVVKASRTPLPLPESAAPTQPQPQPAATHDDNSNTSHSSGQSGTASTSAASEGEEHRQAVPPPLPPALPLELMTLVEQIKHTASTTDNTRKTFQPDINNCLVKIEWKIRDLSVINRNSLFAHLAFYLPCTKDTLMRRAKKLFVHKEESDTETVICKLKATIDATMPSILENYTKECQRVAEEKGIPASPSNGVPGADGQLTPDSPAKLPKKRFPWTDETRSYLKEIVRLRNRCYKVLKPRRSSYEEYVDLFLSSKVKVLWPPGWMKTSTLKRELQRSPHSHSHSKSRHSSSHNSHRSDARLSDSTPNGQAPPSPSNGPASGETSSQPRKPVSITTTPLAAAGSKADPLNLLNKIAATVTPISSLSQPREKQEFSMDCLLKRTSENHNQQDFNTTLSDLMKKDGVIVNGTSLPSVNSKVNERGSTVLDLSSVSVITSVSERTANRPSDSVSVNPKTIVDSNKLVPPSSPSTARKEVCSELPLSRKQRLLQSESSGCDNTIISRRTDKMRWPHMPQKNCSAEGKRLPKESDRRMSEETTTATDILSQIINESLMAPSQPTTPYKDEVKITTNSAESRSQELLLDVMQDLKELNHLSSGGNKVEKNNYGGSWSRSEPAPPHSHTNYHNEFIKHLMNHEQPSPSAPPTAPPSPYNRPFDASPPNAFYNNTLQRSHSHSSQGISSHGNSTQGKMSQMNQVMKSHSNTGITSGLPHHRYQMDYSATDEQHVMGLPYSLPPWFTGSESENHQ